MFPQYNNTIIKKSVNENNSPIRKLLFLFYQEALRVASSSSRLL
jgi:hypothetical protein